VPLLGAEAGHESLKTLRYDRSSHLRAPSAERSLPTLTKVRANSERAEMEGIRKEKVLKTFYTVRTIATKLPKA